MKPIIDPQYFSSSIFAAFLLAVLSGCSSQPVQRSDDDAAREAIINPERGRRGNPATYEVMGRRYFVLGTSAGYRERGMASWYGSDFHGRSTSGGELFDMNALTAAHKTLPIPTWVEVTHLRSGRRIIVKVNDRGPFVDDRLIDLSYAAAESLGMVRAGTALVEVRALGEPAGRPTIASTVAEPAEARAGGFSIISTAAAATPGESDLSMQRVYAQVGAFSKHDNALRLVGTLRAGGFDAAFVVSEVGRSGDLHRVWIGPLADIGAYDEVVEGLVSLGLDESRLIVER